MKPRHSIVPLLALCCVPALAPLAWSSPTEPNELQNELQPPSDCESCHRYDNPLEYADEPDYAPYNSWRGGLMSNAARDPVFWAGVAIASQDHPDETIECIRCHSPRAFLEGRGYAIRARPAAHARAHPARAAPSSCSRSCSPGGGDRPLRACS